MDELQVRIANKYLIEEENIYEDWKELNNPIKRMQALQDINDDINFLTDELGKAINQTIKNKSRFDDIEDITFLEHYLVRAIRTVKELQPKLDDIQKSLKSKIDYLESKKPLEN